MFVLTALACLALAEPSVAIAPVAVDGELEPVWSERLQQAAIEGAARTELPIEALASRARCPSAACWTEVAGSHALVVDVTITVDASAYAVDVAIVRPNDGEVLARSRERCDPCSLLEATESVAGAVAATRLELQRLLRRPAVLRVTTDPTGALLTLDGRDVGRGPWESSVPPGSTTVAASKPGFVAVSRTVALQAGSEHDLHLKLEQLELRDDPRPWRAGGYGALGVGAAGIVAGVVLSAIDSRSVRSRCSGGDIDPDGDCRTLYDTRIPGAVVLGLGVASAITGAVLLVKARRVARGGRARARRGTAWHR